MPLLCISHSQLRLPLPSTGASDYRTLLLPDCSIVRNDYRVNVAFVLHQSFAFLESGNDITTKQQIYDDAITCHKCGFRRRRDLGSIGTELSRR